MQARIIDRSSLGHAQPACQCHCRAAPCVVKSAAAARRRSAAASSRHPDYLTRTQQQEAEVAPEQAGAPPTADQTDDPRYVRSDYSNLLARSARLGFVCAIQEGEARLCVAEAALWASAEDDAIASHSTVPFPVAAFMDRCSHAAQHVRGQLAQAGLLVTPGQPGPDPQHVMQVVEAALFAEPWGREHAHTQVPISSLGFRAPAHGRSALPAGAVVDHAGVWEVARDVYLHEVLVRRTGHPAALACILAQVMAELLVDGSVDFAVAVDTHEFQGAPSGRVLPGITRDMVLRGSSSKQQQQEQEQSTAVGTGAEPGHVWSAAQQAELQAASAAGRVRAPLNTCSSEVVVELQRHLKRCYWCWAWDTRVDAYQQGGSNSKGGFRSAAKAALGDDAMSAAISAISTVAAWRLDRGIWTSPGAGDLRRARAAAERLVLLTDDPEERRDLAVLLLHCGDLGAARVELRAYMRSAQFNSSSVDPFDKVLCQRLMQLLNSAGAIPEPSEPLSAQRELACPEGSEQQEAVKRPLVW